MARPGKLAHHLFLKISDVKSVFWVTQLESEGLVLLALLVRVRSGQWVAAGAFVLEGFSSLEGPWSDPTLGHVVKFCLF